VADIERGIRNLSLVNIEKIAAALDISISALFVDYGVD
jgi:transcriptional regulator with XRE-family HTH domain